MAHSHDHSGLDIKVEHTGPCLAKVTFTVSPEEFQKSRKDALRRVASRTRMKGFRPGKAPLAVLEREYGDAINRDVVQHFLNHALDSAVKQNELRPALQPRVDVDAIEASTEEGFSHAFELVLRPTIELGEVKGMAIESQPTAVTEEEVEAAIEDLRRQQSRPEPAGDEGLPADGMAVVHLRYLVEGQEEAVLEREGIRVSPKSPPPAVEPEVFESALTGSTEGARHRFEITLPDDFPEEAARGKTGVCEIEVKEAFRIRQASDEELYDLFEVENRESLSGKLRERMEQTKAEQERQRIENELLERLIEENPMELPEPLIEQQVEARLAELRQSLGGEGLEGEELEARVTQEAEETRPRTEKALRAIYLLEEIAKTHELQVDGEDLAQEFESIAKRNGVPLDDVRKYYREEGLLQQLAMELLERKVRSFLREAADIQTA